MNKFSFNKMTSGTGFGIHVESANMIDTFKKSLDKVLNNDFIFTGALFRPTGLLQTPSFCSGM